MIERRIRHRRKLTARIQMETAGPRARHMAGGRRAPLSAHLHGHRGTRARRVPNSVRPARARGDGDPCRRSSRARATSISSESRAGGERDARRCEPASIKLKLGTLLLQRAAARRDRGRWEDPAPVLGRPISVAGERAGTYVVRTPCAFSRRASAPARVDAGAAANLCRWEGGPCPPREIGCADGDADAHLQMCPRQMRVRVMAGGSSPAV